MDVVHVRVRSARYGLPVAEVREIQERGRITPVPGSPIALAGVRNLRGTMLPVIELASMLELGPGEPGPLLVVGQADGILAGLAVEDVVGVGPTEGDPLIDLPSIIVALADRRHV
jgi:chemotaxis signal transduction protein